MKYSITKFQQEFPDEDSCLEYIFRHRFPRLRSRYHKVPRRKCYQSTQGRQVYPLKGTIFEKSRTPLLLWFTAIYLLSQASKNGVSAKELQRTLGVTYKTAWRMGQLIRQLMREDSGQLFGIVEADETYIGGRVRKGSPISYKDNKSMVAGVVERGGRIKTAILSNSSTPMLLKFVETRVDKSAIVMSDEWHAYRDLPRRGYESYRVTHSKYEWVRDQVHTNSIEGFWSQLKRSIRGTYVWTSQKHLQSYVDEFAWRYSNRFSEKPLFYLLLERI